jgi:Peptidase family M23
MGSWWRYPVRMVLVMGALLVAVACGSGDQHAAADNGGVRSEDTGDGAKKHESIPAGSKSTQTPLLMRVLAPPEPVKGSDGKYHLVYELVLTNSSPGTATVKSVEAINAGSGEVVGTRTGDDLASRMALLGDISGKTSEKIGSGQVAIGFMDVAFEGRRDIPKSIENRVRTVFDIPKGFASNLFPTNTTDTDGRTEVLNKKPVVIGPPLEGNNWVAYNGCCTVSPHRGAMLALGHRLLAAERYAIDWIKAGDLGFSADGKKLERFSSYGEPIISVANGEVEEVVDKYPDNPPGVLNPDLKLKDAGGNHVIVDIGGGRYAFYAHLKPNSIRVEDGDLVGRGQQIARLGNSGNTSQPHLHFHVVDEPLALGADSNLPYVFDAFDYQGVVEEDGTRKLLKTPEPRRDELPLAVSLVTFAAPEED